MTNFEHAVGATNSALESSGTAFAQNEAYMSGIEAKITSVTAAFQKMSTFLFRYMCHSSDVLTNPILHIFCKTINPYFTNL